MLNEDISIRYLGLFHYPDHEFLPGFTEMPADHFYRAYYLAVYAVFCLHNLYERKFVFFS